MNLHLCKELKDQGKRPVYVVRNASLMDAVL